MDLDNKTEDPEAMPKAHTHSNCSLRPYALALILALSAGCGDDPTPLVPDARPPEPVGAIANQVIVAGETVTLEVSPYFRDPDGGTLTYAPASSAAGVVSVSQSGATLTLVGVAQGTATVTVTASDPDRLTAAQSFQTVVEAANEPPAVEAAIPPQTMTVGQGGTLQLTPYFSDPDGDALSYAANSDRESVVVAGISESRLILTAVTVGTGTVTVTAADPAGLTATQAVRVTVAPPNRAPQPRGTIPARSLAVGDTVPFEVSSYFRDPDGDELSYTGVSDNEDVATVTVSADTLTLVGVAGGTATMTVTAADPDNLTATQSAVVTVVVGNDAPQPVDAIPAQSLAAGDTATLALSNYFSDPDGDELSYTAASGDEQVATATVAGSTLTLAGVRAGTTTVTLTATDPRGLTATQPAAVTVTTATGGFRDDFDSASSLDDWALNSAEVRVQDGLLRLRPIRAGLPGYVSRALALPLTSWEIRTRMGRTGRTSPAPVWFTGHSRFLAFRFEIGNPSDSYDYFMALYDESIASWRRITPLYGNSEAIHYGRDEFTDLTIMFADGILVVLAGETDIIRFTLTNEEMKDALKSVTSFWLAAINVGEALFDYFEVSGVQGAADSAHPSPASLQSATNLLLTSRWADVRPFEPNSNRD